MLEKRLIAIPPQLFTADGSTDGIITVADTKSFKVKQEVILAANTLPNLNNIEIKQIISATQLAVGPKTGNINARTNISAYTVALSSSIFANEQKRPSIPFEELTRAVYEEEPTVAERSILVDKYGNKIDSRVDSNGINRLAVDGQFSAEVDVQVDVDVDGEYNATTNPDPDNIGLIGHQRSNPTNQTHQNQRITAKRGTVDTDTVSEDVSLHDENGNSYTDINYVPVGQSTHDNFNGNANLQVSNVDVSSANPVPTQNILATFISSTNSSSVNLGPNEVWEGTWIDVERYTDAAISVYSDQDSATDGLKILYSIDGITETDSDIYTILKFKGNPTTVGLTTKYFKVRYTNGPIGTATFLLQTKIFLTRPKPSSIRIADEINGQHDAELVKSNITVQKPNGEFSNVQGSEGGAFLTAVENLVPTSSGSFFIEGIRDDIEANFSTPAGLTKIYDDGSVNGIVEHDSVEGRANFSTGATPGSTAIFRSKKKAIYESGHQITGEQTISVSSLPTGDASVFWGWSDGYNSLGYLLDASGLAVVRKKNGVLQEKIYQTGWNKDQCLGQKFSKFLFNFSPQALNSLENNIFRVTFEWLGTAPIKFYVKGPNDSNVLAHILEHPNQEPGTTISNPSLPLSVEIHNDSTIGGNITVSCGCFRGGVHTNKTVTNGKTPDEDFSDVRIQGRHSLNSTLIPLDANFTYRGEWFPWQQNYIKMLNSCYSDVPGTLYIDLSEEETPVNGDDSSILESVSLPYDPLISPSLRRQTPLESRWVRVRYVNGNAAQSVFTLGTAFLTADPGIVNQSLRILPTYNNDAGIIRSIPTIPNASGTGFQETPVHPVSGNPKTDVSNIRDDILLKPLTQPLVRQIVVGTVPTRLDPVQVPNRRSTLISNDGPAACSVGFSSAITFDSLSMRMTVGAVRILPFSEAVEYWAVSQNVGGTQTTLTRSGTTAGGTAINPSNALVSDNVYANINTNTQTVSVTGYTAGTTNDLVSVKIGMEANKQSGQVETVSIAEIQSGATTGSGTISSAALTGGTSQLYVAIISRNSSTNIVTGVSGGGNNFTPALQNVSSGNRRMDLWYFYGDFSLGAVTANMSTSTNGHITVYRILNADPTTPIESISSTTGTGTAVTGPTISGTNKGYSILAISHLTASGTPGVGYTEDADFTNGTGSNVDSLATESKALTATGLETAIYTLISSSDWATIGLTILPGPGKDPKVTLSYELSAVPGATSALATINSFVDSNYLIDITSDRAWTFSDIANLTAIVTGTDVGAAAANIDYLYVELVDTTGAITRLSVVQGGEAVV